MSLLLRDRGEGADQVAFVAARLSRGDVHLGAGFSAGPWTPAVPDEFGWAVLDLRGCPVFLCRDAYEAAVRFLEYETGAVEYLRDEPGLYPFQQAPDAYLAAVVRWDRWFEEYKFSRRGDPQYDPPYPRREDYEP